MKKDNRLNRIPLKLRREQIRLLSQNELQRAVGGQPDNDPTGGSVRCGSLDESNMCGG
jgi:hypothetical protein